MLVRKWYGHFAPKIWNHLAMKNNGHDPPLQTQCSMYWNNLKEELHWYWFNTLHGSAYVKKVSWRSRGSCANSDKFPQTMSLEAASVGAEVHKFENLKHFFFFFKWRYGVRKKKLPDLLVAWGYISCHKHNTPESWTNCCWFSCIVSNVGTIFW